MHKAQSWVQIYGTSSTMESYAKKCQKIYASAQLLGALRKASCYQTVSEPAALVVAGVIPIDLLVHERSLVYTRSTKNGRKEARKEAREMILDDWQTRWNEESRGRWTARMIPNIRRWINRKDGEVNYYLTQLLTGHGYFKDFLHKIGKVSNAA